ncbi:MAG: hypothetical protein ACLQVX_18510 [Limisphaerales bacterium]
MFFGLICLQNPLSERFEPICFPSGEDGRLLLKLGLFGDEGIFDFLEFLEFHGAFGEGVVDPVDLGLEGRKLGLEAVNLGLVGLVLLGLPSLDLGHESLLPFLGNGGKPRVALDLLGEFLLPDEAAVVADLLLVLVRAAVVVEPETAFLDVALSGDAITA